MDKSYRVVKPVFIVGSGRSGTTLLFRLLHGHPDLAYISNLTDNLPGLPQLSLFNRIRSIASLKLFRPSYESIPAFAKCGITEEQLISRKQPLTEQDVNDNVRQCFYKLVARHEVWSGKPRFINKNTSNTMRIRFLREIFPDALFVHIIRNGYGVVNSLTNVDWWRDLELWWLGQTPAQWEAGGGNRYELAALHWKRQLTHALEQLQYIPASQHHECRYEALLENPRREIRRILEFAGLEWNEGYQRYYDGVSVRSGNIERWRTRLDSDAKQAIFDASGDIIETLGYPKT